MPDPIDYAALIRSRSITDRHPINLGGVVVRVVMRGIPEEEMWELSQRWESLPKDEVGRASDNDMIGAAYVGLEDAAGNRIDVPDALPLLLGRVTRDERRALLALAIQLATVAPEVPFSAPPSETTNG